MKKGDIVFGRKKSDAIHPIVYLREYDINFFIGAMLTKSNRYKDNILMLGSHFNKEGSKGRKYKFNFNNTHLVKTELIKKDEWKPFKKVGELTGEGIKFVESNIKQTNPILWEDYLSMEEIK